MQHRDKQKYLSDMRDRATFVVEVLGERSQEDLNSDRILRSAIERELSVLGEALYQLHQLDPQLAEKIDNWREIIRFRHVLVHGYSILKMDMIWDVAMDDLTPLIQQLDVLMADNK